MPPSIGTLREVNQRLFILPLPWRTRCAERLAYAANAN